MADSEIMESLNITEKEFEKYLILSAYHDFKNINTTKRILIALDAGQNFKTKKSTKRTKHREDVKSTHR